MFADTKSGDTHASPQAERDKAYAMVKRKTTVEKRTKKKNSTDKNAIWQAIGYITFSSSWDCLQKYSMDFFTFLED
jgi:hypothetical protein